MVRTHVLKCVEFPRVFGGYVRSSEVPSSAEAAIHELEGRESIEYAQFNYYYYPASTFPNEITSGRFDDQWGLHNTGQVFKEGLPAGTEDVDIDAPEAWDFETGDSSVIIATLDTGANRQHGDLQGNIWINDDPLGNGDEDNNGYVDDTFGWNFSNGNRDIADVSLNSHGTHVAGIIGAVGNNGQGVSGIMWDVSIMPVKMFGGSNPSPPSSSSTVVSAIDYAVDNGADIVNGSFVGATGSVVADNAVRDAIGDASSTLFVFSAGNFEQDNDDPSTDQFPCSFSLSNIICVGAVNSSGAIWDNPSIAPGTIGAGSNYGLEKVDLVAPGVEILSTTAVGAYGYLIGTSMSAPMVAGIAGLILSKTPGLVARELVDAILLSAELSPTSELDGLTYKEAIANARLAINAFGDSWDAAADDTPFLYWYPWNARLAAVNVGSPVVCNLYIETASHPIDHAVAATFSKGGTTNNTFVSYQSGEYLPGSASQTMFLQIETQGGGDLDQESGRIGTGVVGETGLSTSYCLIYYPYQKATIGGAAIAGVDLDLGKAFVYFDPPYSEVLSSSLASSILARPKLTIQVTFRSLNMDLVLRDPEDGSILHQELGISYPGTWNWTGTHAGAFRYYGTVNETSGTLLVRSFLSADEEIEDFLP